MNPGDGGGIEGSNPVPQNIQGKGSLENTAPAGKRESVDVENSQASGAKEQERIQSAQLADLAENPPIDSAEDLIEESKLVAPDPQEMLGDVDQPNQQLSQQSVIVDSTINEIPGESSTSGNAQQGTQDASDENGEQEEPREEEVPKHEIKMKGGFSEEDLTEYTSKMAIRQAIVRAASGRPVNFDDPRVAAMVQGGTEGLERTYQQMVDRNEYPTSWTDVVDEWMGSAQKDWQEQAQQAEQQDEVNPRTSQSADGRYTSQRAKAAADFAGKRPLEAWMMANGTTIDPDVMRAVLQQRDQQAKREQGSAKGQSQAGEIFLGFNSNEVGKEYIQMLKTAEGQLKADGAKEVPAEAAAAKVDAAKSAWEAAQKEANERARAQIKSIIDKGGPPDNIKKTDWEDTIRMQHENSAATDFATKNRQDAAILANDETQYRGNSDLRRALDEVQQTEAEALVRQLAEMSVPGLDFSKGIPDDLKSKLQPWIEECQQAIRKMDADGRKPEKLNLDEVLVVADKMRGEEKTANQNQSTEAPINVKGIRDELAENLRSEMELQKQAEQQSENSQVLDASSGNTPPLPEQSRPQQTLEERVRERLAEDLQSSDSSAQSKAQEYQAAVAEKQRLELLSQVGLTTEQIAERNQKIAEQDKVIKRTERDKGFELEADRIGKTTDKTAKEQDHDVLKQAQIDAWTQDALEDNLSYQNDKAARDKLQAKAQAENWDKTPWKDIPRDPKELRQEYATYIESKKRMERAEQASLLAATERQINQDTIATPEQKAEALRNLEKAKQNENQIILAENRKEAVKEEIRKSNQPTKELLLRFDIDPEDPNLDIDDEIEGIKKMVNDDKRNFTSEEKKLLQRLKEMRATVVEKELRGNLLNATTDTERQEIMNKMANNMEDIRSNRRKWLDNVAESLGSEFGEQKMQELRRQTQTYSRGLQGLKQDLKEATTPGEKERIESNIQNLKKQLYGARRELLSKNLLKGLAIWFFILGPAALTILPLWGAAKFIETQGKGH